jgi:hypothetical protein
MTEIDIMLNSGEALKALLDDYALPEDPNPGVNVNTFLSHIGKSDIKKNGFIR